MNKTLSLFAILAMCFCFSAATAKADGGTSGDLLYTLTGPASDPITLTFELPVNPTIGTGNYVSGFGFQVNPIDLTVNNELVNNDCLFFYNNAWGGGFEDNNGLFSFMNPDGSNVPVLYSGDESAPTMLTTGGPVTLTNFVTDSGDYTLTVTTATAPEPASMMLLASGIVALCLMRKFRSA